MAVEIRRILYSADEFKAIAKIYVNLVGPSMGLPEGTVMAVDILADDPLEVRVHIQAEMADRFSTYLTKTTWLPR
jgi:hypothetical protein